MRLWTVSLLLLLVPPGAEPAPTPARPLPFRTDLAIAHVSSARELPDGRVWISDPGKPALYLLNPMTGHAEILGSPGAGEKQYVEPGGLYGGPDDTTLVFDRAQARLLTISADAKIGGSSSVVIRGVQMSTSRDVDLERPDARGHAYFVMSSGFSPNAPNTADLRRLDPVTQHTESVTTLGRPASKNISLGDGRTFGRTVIGSPADGWGVTPDGRVAVVRGAPYRVEWHGLDGRIVLGPVIDYVPLPMTDADRAAFKETAGRGSVGAGMVGGSGGAVPDPGPQFAATKAPFDPDDIVVSPAGRVWVRRTGPAGARTVVYDVFDGTGRRTARIDLPADSQVIGFGPAAIYVRAVAGDGGVTLKKYGA